MNETIIELSLEKKLKRLQQEDELLDFIVESSVDWGNMLDSEFEEFQQQLYDIVELFVLKKEEAVAQ